MREMHRWGAHAMVITVWLHMFRVFMTGSYKPPREFNWSVGVIMLVLTLLLSFTGYLLPWDQLAIWAITVGSNMARATPFLGYEGPGAQLLGSATCR
jgi:Cytochrome b subunit of the bc complex